MYIVWCLLHDLPSGSPHVQAALDDLENAQSTIRGWKSRPQLGLHETETEHVFETFFANLHTIWKCFF